MAGEQAMAAGKYYQVGRLRFEHQLNGRWGVSNGMIGVGNYRTPFGALLAFRYTRAVRRVRGVNAPGVATAVRLSAMPAEPTRVVLVKPGDVLILGNITVTDDREHLDALGELAGKLKDVLGLKHVVICEDDVSIAAETPGAPRRPSLAEYTDEDAVRAAWAQRGFTPGEIDELAEVWRAHEAESSR